MHLDYRLIQLKYKLQILVVHVLINVLMLLILLEFHLFLRFLVYALLDINGLQVTLHVLAHAKLVIFLTLL